MNEKEYEFKVNIGGIDYGMDALTNVHYEQPLFDKFDVGLVCSACLTVSYYFDLDPPKMAQVIAYYRIKGSEDTWKQLGVFYVATRETKKYLKTLTCYDSILRADIPFLTEGDPGEWPRSMYQVTQEIVQLLGIELDSRTEINPSTEYTLDYPNEDTARTLLGYIAAANLGNWIVTAENKLLLVPLFSSAPAETNYLIDEDGDTLLFGDTRILIE